MSMGPLGGIVGSAAGTSLSQTAGAETERSQRDSAAQQRQTDGNERTERAAGVGQTEEDQESSERDADGRRLWENTYQAGEGLEGRFCKRRGVVIIETEQGPDGAIGDEAGFDGLSHLASGRTISDIACQPTSIDQASMNLHRSTN